jgi:polyisoprenoid-binding protein YceI
VMGKLTMKGITREVVIPIALKKDANGNSVAEGSFPLKRTDYKVGEGMWSDTDMVADDVLVRIRMVLPRVA